MRTSSKRLNRTAFRKTEPDPRFDKITDLVLNFSAGNFDYKIEPARRYDEIDAFITMLNMMGEELQSSMISRNYFNDVFHSVSDMLFVLSNTGTINAINASVSDKLHFMEYQLKNRSIDDIMGGVPKTFEQITRGLCDENQVMDIETTFYCRKGKPVPVYCSYNYLFNKHKEKIGYLLIARDLSKIKK